MATVSTFFSAVPPRRRGEADFLNQRLQDEITARRQLLKKHLPIIVQQDDIPLTALAPHSCDLFISIGWLAATNDVVGALASIHRALRPGGLFLAALYGGGTLAELRTSLLSAEAATGGASLRVAPMLNASSAVQLLQRCGFETPVVDTDVLTATYKDMQSLVHDLRASRMAGVLAAKRFLPRAVWDAASQHYQQNFHDPRGRITATFEAIYLSGWKAEESK